MGIGLGDLTQLGAVLVVALALVETLKVVILKLLNGNEGGIHQTVDGFAKEVAWRVEIGSIVREQHEIQKDMRSLLGAHHEESKIARKQIEKIHKDVKELHDDVKDVKGSLQFE